MKLLDYDLVISDVDGVVIREDEPIWNNIKALRKFLEAGKKVIFLTNNSGFDRVLLARKFNYLGLNISYKDIITSGVAAIEYMKERTNIKTVYPVGEEGLIEELKRSGFTVFSTVEAEEKVPDAVVIGLDRHCNYDKLSVAMRCIFKGSKFIVTNMDRLWPSMNGLKLGAGALASAIIYALNRQPDFIAGKPNPWIIQVALKAVGMDKIPSSMKVIIVGDQLETDIKMAKELGIDSALVLTGISTLKDLEKNAIKPTYV
ncbi:MAG: HAD-IIA family hydrolase, partial [Sulfolobales archaeon]